MQRRRRGVRKGRARGMVSKNDMKSVVQIRNPMLPIPPNRNLQPGFNKIVRYQTTFTTGVALNVTSNFLFITDAADYGVASRGWASMKIHSVKLWGPTQAAALTPEVLIQVFSATIHTSATAIAQYSAPVDTTSTNARPFVGFRYGAANSHTPWQNSVQTILIILAASPTGEYTMDFDCTFN